MMKYGDPEQDLRDVPGRISDHSKARMARIAQLENKAAPKEPVTAPTKDDGLTVSGAGTKEANGVYELKEVTHLNGKPLYENKDGHYIQNEKDINGGKSFWVLRSLGLVFHTHETDGDILYYVESNADAPPKNGWTDGRGSPDSSLSIQY